jgi:hypothetical protein
MCNCGSSKSMFTFQPKGSKGMLPMKTKSFATPKYTTVSKFNGNFSKIINRK